MIHIIHKRRFRIQLAIAISKKQIKVISFMLVNDTDLEQRKSTFSQQDIEEVTEEIQCFIDYWKECLKAIGGTLCPNKSFAYPISFKFRLSGVVEFKRVEDIGIQLLVKVENKRREILTLLDTDKEAEILRVCLVPDRNIVNEI